MTVDLSVIIPNWNCPYLINTIEDLLNKASGNIEIVVTIGDQRPEKLVERNCVTYIYSGKSRGMRFGINTAAALAKGKYVMKTDDHCMFAPGFDKVLIENHHEDNWVQIPRRYSLNPQEWKIDEGRPYRDYHYLSYPDPNSPEGGLRGMEWPDMTMRKSDPKYDIDDLMSFQGSCWFMTKNYFDNFLGGLSIEQYGMFAQEPQEIGLKTWLGGGRLVINKKTWYAHFHKNKDYAKSYPVAQSDRKDLYEGHIFTTDYWINNKWDQRIHDFDWLIEKFWPIPGWPNNWKELI